MIVSTTYMRQVTGHGCWLGETPIEIEAEVFQDGGEHTGSELLVIWTDETLASLASLDFDMSELEGAQEAIEEAYWASERDQCRASITRQQSATEESFAEVSAA